MLLTGRDLEIALSRTERPITLLDASDKRVRDITPDEAILLLLAGNEAGGSKRRVRYVRPRSAVVARSVDTVDNRTFEIDSDFWDGRGCLRFWSDQKSVEGVCVNA